MPDRPTPYQLLLRVRLSARDHQQRRTVYLRRARLASYLNIVASLGTVIAVLQGLPMAVKVGLPFSITLFALADTLFGFTASAFEHQSLYRRYLELEQDLTGDHPPPDALSQVLAIEADEPPVNRAAADRCDNELLIAEGHEPTHRVGWLRQLSAAI
jgi:hypothetical protein